MQCKNCGEQAKGNFCPHCGQRTRVTDISWASLLQELSEGLFQINRGFFRTFFDLFRKPGQMIRAFLQGKRKDHFKPISYVLVLSTAYFIISQLTGENTWLGDVVMGFSEGITDEGSDREVPAILVWFSNNYAYATLLSLPIFSLSSYLAFRSFNRHFLEHMVLNAYITGQQAFFYSFSLLIHPFFDSEMLEIGPFVLSVLYNFWVFWHFFASGNRVLNILRSVFTYLLYLVLSTVLVSLLVTTANL